MSEEIPKLTPLDEWADEAGLDYERAYRLVNHGHLEARQFGNRWYVIGNGLPEDEPQQQS
jgi:hypothetical protein